MNSVKNLKDGRRKKTKNTKAKPFGLANGYVFFIFFPECAKNYCKNIFASCFIEIKKHLFLYESEERKKKRQVYGLSASIDQSNVNNSQDESVLYFGTKNGLTIWWSLNYFMK